MRPEGSARGAQESEKGRNLTVDWGNGYRMKTAFRRLERRNYNFLATHPHRSILSNTTQTLSMKTPMIGFLECALGLSRDIRQKSCHGVNGFAHVVGFCPFIGAVADAAPAPHKKHSDRTEIGHCGGVMCGA